MPLAKRLLLLATISAWFIAEGFRQALGLRPSGDGPCTRRHECCYDGPCNGRPRAPMAKS